MKILLLDIQEVSFLTNED